MDPLNAPRCRSGRHAWLDEVDRYFCCHPDFFRVKADRRDVLEKLACRHIVFRGGLFLGWQPREQEG